MGGHPPEKVFVSVHTKPFIDRKNRGEKLSVSVRMSKGSGDAVGSASIDVDCYSFSSGQRMMPETDLEAFYEIGKAAVDGKDARKEVVTKTFQGDMNTLYESADTTNGKMIRVTRGDETVDFSPEEAELVRAAVAEAEIGKAWFEKILVATEFPEASPDARPPRSGGYSLNSESARTFAP